MLICKRIRQSALLLAVAGLLIPTQCFAQSPVENQPTHLPATGEPASIDVQPVDASLDPGDVLRGAVVDNAGTAAPFATVVLLRKQQIIAIGQTNEDGKFAISNVRGGVYQIASGDRVTLLRCWTDGTAPPAAKKATLLQVSDVQRAQISPATCAIMNPWVIAGVALAAIIIPIAIDSNRDDRDASS